MFYVSINANDLFIFLHGRVYWLPLVTDETREGYEAYASDNKDQFMASFVKESGLRAKQDAQYGLSNKVRRALQDQPGEYNARIFGMKGDNEIQPEGSGPFCKF